ncbi:MAG: secondary thiamine-phosphate synthase enzyme YjbQ [Planctomycetes bacterium]|nr:secondary thiamine-phosphate synthase enzyme YjbQ [Planctomycetota bacterium]
MDPMKLQTETFEIVMDKGPDIKNITDRLASILARSGIFEGVLHAFNVGSTGSLTTIEDEPGVVEDLGRALKRWAPQNLEYAHEEAWHDGNGHSHVQAALMGPSLSLPVRNGRLFLGTWQQVVVINHDNHARRRQVAITVIGR